MSHRFQKDPDAILDYQIDWSDWIGSDTISDSIWIADPGIDVESSSNDGTTATIWLSGGSVGEKYNVTNRINTIDGRTDDRTFVVAISNK